MAKEKFEDHYSAQRSRHLEKALAGYEETFREDPPHLVEMVLSAIQFCKSLAARKKFMMEITKTGVLSKGSMYKTFLLELVKVKCSESLEIVRTILNSEDLIHHSGFTPADWAGVLRNALVYQSVDIADLILQKEVIKTDAILDDDGNTVLHYISKLAVSPKVKSLQTKQYVLDLQKKLYHQMYPKLPNNKSGQPPIVYAKDPKVGDFIEHSIQYEKYSKQFPRCATEHIKWMLTGNEKHFFSFIKETCTFITSSKLRTPEHENAKKWMFGRLAEVVKGADLINNSDELLQFLKRYGERYKKDKEISNNISDVYYFLSYELFIFNKDKDKALKFIDLASKFYRISVENGWSKNSEVEEGMKLLQIKLQETLEESCSIPFWLLIKWTADFNLLFNFCDLIENGKFIEAEELLGALPPESRQGFANALNNAKKVFEAEKIIQPSEPEPKPVQAFVKSEPSVSIEEIEAAITSSNWDNPRVTWKHIQKYFRLEKSKAYQASLSPQSQKEEIPAWEVDNDTIIADASGEVIQITPNLYGMIKPGLKISDRNLEIFKNAIGKGITTSKKQNNGVKLIKNGKGEIYEVTINSDERIYTNSVYLSKSGKKLLCFDHVGNHEAVKVALAQCKALQFFPTNIEVLDGAILREHKKAEYKKAEHKKAVHKVDSNHSAFFEAIDQSLLSAEADSSLNIDIIGDKLSFEHLE